MKNLLLILLIGIISSCQPKSNDWNNLKEFIIYKKQGILPNKTDNASYLIKKNDLIKSIFDKAEAYDSIFLWKGYYLAKAKFKNNKESFFKLSKHGGMIYDIENKKLYKISNNMMSILLKL